MCFKIIEAHALDLFVPSTNLLHFICAQSSVAVPVLLHHDPVEHVLVMSDLGSHPILSDIFSAIGGYSPTCGPPETQMKPGPQHLSYFRTIGTKIGSFLARLHSPATIKLVLSRSGYDSDFLSNPTLRPMIFEHAIKPIKEQIERFPSIVAEHDTADL